MPYTDARLPFSGRAPVAAQASYEAAKHAASFAPDQCARLLAFYLECGARGATDAEAAEAMAWPANVVTARRNDLVDRGQVVVRWPECRRFSSRTPKLRVTVWLASACV